MKWLAVERAGRACCRGWLGQKNPVAVRPAWPEYWARFPTGARLGKGARDGTALVCGVPRGCFPLGRIPEGGTPLRRGFRGGTPLPGGHARSEAGILRDGFGVPSARNIACDV